MRSLTQFLLILLYTAALLIAFTSRASFVDLPNETRFNQLIKQANDSLGSNKAASAEKADQALALIQQWTNEKHFEKVAEGLSTLTKLADALDDPVFSSRVAYAKGTSLYKQKRYLESIETFSTILALLGHDNKSNAYPSQDESKKLLANAFHQIAQSYKRLRNTPKSIENYKNALVIHQIRNDEWAIGKALKNVAMAENKFGAFVSALDNALKSLEILKTHSAPQDLAEVLLLTGIIYRNIGHYEKSLDYILQAQKIYEDEADIVHLAEVDNQTGLIYSTLGQYDNARSFYQKTLALPVEQVKPETRAAAFREIGVIDFEAGKYVSALSMLNQSNDIYRGIQYTSQTAYAELLIGNVEHASGNEDVAAEHYRIALAHAIQARNVEVHIMALNAIGDILVAQNVDSAQASTLQALALAIEEDNKAEQLRSYSILKDIEIQRENPSAALDFSEKMYALSKVIQREREEAELMQANAMLESYKMEVDLQALREKVKLDSLTLAQQNSEIELVRQANRISELELSKNKSANYFLTIMLCFSGIIVFVVFRSFSAARAKNRELHYLATRDPLTECYNRRILFDRLERDFEKASNSQHYSIILADIDFFKSINDENGHSVGDEVLRKVANILQDLTREADTVARFGGEEFCILLPNTSSDDAKTIANRMREKIEMSDCGVNNLTCSFGLATVQNSSESQVGLIERADLALYQSKSRGRNRVTIWDDSLQQGKQK